MSVAAGYTIIFLIFFGPMIPVAYGLFFDNQNDKPNHNQSSDGDVFTEVAKYVVGETPLPVEHVANSLDVLLNLVLITITVISFIGMMSLTNNSKRF